VERANFLTEDGGGSKTVAMTRRPSRQVVSLRPTAPRLCASALVPLLLASACGLASRGAGGPAVGGAVIATIPTDAFGTGIALSPDGSRAYVATAAQVLTIDTAAAKVVGKIRTGDNPYAITLSADGSRGYAVDITQQKLWVLDLKGGTIARTVRIGPPTTPSLRPGVALSGDGKTAYVTISRLQGQGFDTLELVDTATGSKSQRGFDMHPGQLVVDRDGRLWVAGCLGLCAQGTLRVIDLSQPGSLARFDLPSVPAGIALTPDGSRVYVANGLAGSVTAVDVQSRTKLGDVRVGAEPLGIAVSPDGRTAYVTNFASGTLSAIDVATNTVTASASVGESPRAIAISPDGKRAYVTHSTQVVSIVDLTRLGS
jgi:YVTN family beta-propeller protein